MKTKRRYRVIAMSSLTEGDRICQMVNKKQWCYYTFLTAQPAHNGKYMTLVCINGTGRVKQLRVSPKKPVWRIIHE